MAVVVNGAHRDRVVRLVAAFGPDVARLCDACVAVLPGVDGAGLTVMTAQPGQHVRYTSDPISAQIEELQLTLGEGPCQDAHTTGQPILAADLGDVRWQRHWPVFSGEALKAGAGAVFALPLHVGVVRLGVIDLYRTDPGVLAGDELSEALAFADAAIELMLAEQLPGAVPGGDQPFAHRAVVHQATGMVSAQLGIPMAQVFLRLRARAYADEIGLDELAREVVERRLRFTAADTDGES
ncbi:GAF and ANTAR domain-containing protein [Paractinoplanes toevensis]|uniref:GAF domain-containing protein n=1 Tax=Paractinoplanes toevensis TaxID=571911 RepID=A0A919T5Z6_9ACTN|nr:GAF and ANTAR domain-containing protein [Actinoplanes toevensis]GIM89798.1 GAF domain-containing protein [Actinoplanes toevensis]